MTPRCPNMDPWDWKTFPKAGLRPHPWPGERDHQAGSPEGRCVSVSYLGLAAVLQEQAPEAPQQGTVLILLFIAVCHIISQASVSPAVNEGLKRATLPLTQKNPIRRWQQKPFGQDAAL